MKREMKRTYGSFSRKDIINFLRQLPEEERRQLFKEAMREVKKEARKVVKKEAETFFTRVKKKPVDLEKIYGFPVSYKDEIANLAVRGKTHKEIANALDLSLYREQKLWKEAVKEAHEDGRELRSLHLDVWRARQREITSKVDARLERLKKEGKTESRREARKNIIENQRDGLYWKYHPNKGSELGRRIAGRGSP